MADARTGVKLVSRYFTTIGENVFDKEEWGRRRAYLFDNKANQVLIDWEVEAPVAWSDTAVNIAAWKYFRRKGVPTPEGRETSIRQMVDRVATAISKAGETYGYFTDPTETQVFYEELCHLLLHQKAAFNSPVWFNVGMYEKYGISRPTDSSFYCYNPASDKIEDSPDTYARPQCSACFIQSIQDTLEDIFDLVKRESRLFKWGSGTGTNFSTLRSRFEKLSTGGNPSGLLSFLKVLDAGAGATKSGGITRRAAKMVIVNIDHPEVEDFIQWKSREEEKAQALIRAGYDSDFNGEAYHTVAGQNSNNSIRVTDEFMQAYLAGEDWQTKAVTTGEVVQTYKARDLMRLIAESAWRCADPGMQYDTTVNRWHTCPISGRINASNPCSEFMFIDNSACNLSSINLVKFTDEDGKFDVDAFDHAIELMTLAQDILVDYSSYPVDTIALNSHRFRPLGLGYANLGAYLMRLGMPYDSAEGRNVAAAITAIMTGRAYAMSAKIASKVGVFADYPQNAEPMLAVIQMHKYAAENLREVPDAALQQTALIEWVEALNLGKEFGYRNSQTTLLAPTGTIGPLMDVDTTGIEPDFALVKYKKLSGGGGYSIINQSVEPALKNLGYTGDQIEQIKQYVLEHGTIEGAPEIKTEDLPIFDCANKCNGGVRFIQPMGHIEMMAAVQPFLSGAISKTVNMPEEATIEAIEEIYIEAWRRGLKAIALYRDNCKASQPLTVKGGSKEGGMLTVPSRHRDLPHTREGITHKVVINGQHKVYITANKFENGDLGEVFINAGLEGSVVSGLLTAMGILCSKMLQEGVPVEAIVASFLNLRFDPWGITNNPDIPMAKSMTDYIGRWLGMNFLPLDRQMALGIMNGNNHTESLSGGSNGDSFLTISQPPESKPAVESADQPVLTLNMEANGAPDHKYDYKYAPLCPTCGALMVRSGTCFACRECATTTGCS